MPLKNYNNSLSFTRLFLKKKVHRFNKSTEFKRYHYEVKANRYSKKESFCSSNIDIDVDW